MLQGEETLCKQILDQGSYFIFNSHFMAQLSNKELSGIDDMYTYANVVKCIYSKKEQLIYMI